MSDTEDFTATRRRKSKKGNKGPRGGGRPPAVAPSNVNPPIPRPPRPPPRVQLTWKGVEIYFPRVVLSRELKERADDALKKLRESKDQDKQSQPDAETPSTSSSPSPNKKRNNRKSTKGGGDNHNDDFNDNTPAVIIKQELSDVEDHGLSPPKKSTNQTDHDHIDIADAITKGGSIYCPACTSSFQQWTAYERHFRQNHDDKAKEKEKDKTESEIELEKGPPSPASTLPLQVTPPAPVAVPAPSPAAQNLDGKSVKCDQCSRTFKELRYLKQHICTPTCPYCSKIFTTMTACKTHVKTVHKCTHCGDDLKDPNVKKDHVKICRRMRADLPVDSEILDNHYCPTCRTLLPLRDLMFHMKSHEGEEQEKDKEKEKTTTTNDDQNNSVRDDHDDDDGPHMDDDHMDRDHDSDSDSGQPPTVPVKKEPESPLKTIPQTSSSGIKCHICSQQFPDKEQLSKHSLIHVIGNSSVVPPTASPPVPVGPSPTVYTCKFTSCCHFFSHDEDLWYHIEKKHKNVGHTCCGQCGQDFNSQKEVDEHEGKAHPSSVPEVPNASPVLPIPNPSTEVGNPVEELQEEEQQQDPLSSVGGEADFEYEYEDEAYQDQENQEDSFEIYNDEGEEMEEGGSFMFSIFKDFHNENNEDEEEPGTSQDQEGTQGHGSSRRGRKTGADGISFNSIPDQDLYKCHICENREFDAKYPYFIHLRYHAKIKREEGQDRPIRRPDERRKHNPLDDIPDQDEYTCDICEGEERKFTMKKAYFNHMHYHNIIFKKWGHHRTIRSREEVNSNEDSIPDKDEYDCDICQDDRKFETKKAYLQHMSYHKLIFSREGRHRRIKTKEELYQERRKYDDIPDQDEYVCEICNDGRKFSPKPKYIAHLGYHDKIKQMEGKHRRVKNKDEMAQERNAKLASIPDKDVYDCEICGDGRTFDTKQAYFRHYLYHEKIKREEGEHRKIMTPEERSQLVRERAANIEKKGPPNKFTPSTCHICDDGHLYKKEQAYNSHMYYHRKIREEEGKDRPVDREHKGPRNRKRRGSDSDEGSQTGRQYVCNICHGRTFERSSLYHAHMSYHRHIRQKEGKDRPFNLRAKKGESSLDIPHQDVYTCDYCEGREFTDRLKYIAHRMYHNRTGIRGPISNRTNTVPKIRNRIPLLPFYTCKQCKTPKTYKDRKQYIAHLNYHAFKNREDAKTCQTQSQSEGVYRCKLCPVQKTFSVRQNFIAHLWEHRRKDKKDGVNEEEEKDKPSTSTSGSDNSKKYKCKSCDKAFDDPWYLARHEKMQHPGMDNQEDQDDPPVLKKFSCNDCGKRFTTRVCLKNHKDSTCKKVPCKYTCHCGDKFHSVDALETHVIKMHSTSPTKTTHRCYVCKSEFSLPNELEEHVKENHPEDYEEFQQFRKGQHQDQDQQDGEGDEPIYPEVLMGDDDKQEEQEQETENSPIDMDDSNDQEDNVEPHSGWNFIPLLAGDDKNDDDESEEEDGGEYEGEETQNQQDMLNFEPEDVDVPQQEQDEEPIPTPTPVIEDNSNSNFSTSSNSNSNDFQNNKRRRISQDEDWVPGGNYHHQQQQSSTNPNLPVINKKRKFKDSGRYKCGYCDKHGSRIAHLRAHFVVHKGLPFKYINLDTNEVNSDSIVSVEGRILPESLPPSVANESQITLSSIISTSTTRIELDVRPALRQYITNRSVATVSPMAQTQNTVSTSNAPTSTSTSTTSSSSSGGPIMRGRSISVCSCQTEDTALGYHKRCTGVSCRCYSKYKGCGERCDCKQTCGNPFFRTTQAPVPDLVPVQPQQTTDSSDSTTTNASDLLNNLIEAAITKHLSTGAPQPQPLTLQTVATSTVASTLSLGITSAPTPPTIVPQFQQNGQMPIRFLPTLQQRQQNTASTAFAGHVVVPGRVPPTPGVPSVPNNNPRRTSNPTSRIYRCFCRRDFESLLEFLRHQWAHKDEKLFLCPICKKEFAYVGLLILHAKQNHQDLMADTFGTTLCVACDKHLFDRDFRHHFVNAHSNLHCRTCGKYTVNAVDYAMHKANHPICGICKGEFLDDAAWREHCMREHSSEANKVPQGPNANIIPEVVTLDDDVEVLEPPPRPPSPQAPVIVAVSGSGGLAATVGGTYAPAQNNNNYR